MKKKRREVVRKQKKEVGTGEIVFQLRARTALVEDPSSVPSTMSADSTISDVL